MPAVFLFKQLDFRNNLILYKSVKKSSLILNHVITCDSLMGIWQETIPNPMLSQFLLIEKLSS
ncbi:hypothetical protein COF64_22370 [Bacillus sp. AFS043905]|nr:hypothetical protein COF64_22370 [Bacillus sp. AFS043905]